MHSNIPFLRIALIGAIGGGLLTLIILGISAFGNYTNFASEKRNKELCWEYATLSHEKEFTSERWVDVGKMNWTPQMWYDACLDNIHHPVAGR